MTPELLILSISVSTIGGFFGAIIAFGLVNITRR